MIKEEGKGKKVVAVEEKGLRSHVNAVLQTESGKALWAHLFHECGYNVTSLTRKADGEVAALSTECKEAQRLIYIGLRKLADRGLLAKAEELAEAPAPAVQPKEEARN